MLLDNIKYLCMQNGISIHRLEKDLGFGNGSIAKWDSASPSLERVRRVSEYFGVTIDELVRERAGEKVK